MLVAVYARQGRVAQIRFRSEPPGELHDLSYGSLTFGLINRRAPHLALDTDRRSNRRDEYHIARKQFHIIGGITADQHVVQIEVPNDCALALQLNIAQRSDGTNTSRRKQRRGNRSETADGV